MKAKFKFNPKPRKAAQSAVSQVQPKLQQAFILFQQGQLPQAQLLFEEILKIQPRNFDALHLSGLIAAQTKNPQKAAQLIGQAIEINPNQAAAYSNLGAVLQELQHLDAALQSYDKAIALKADFAEAFNNRGTVLQKLQQLDTALQSFDKAIALKADYAEAYFNRGTVLQEINQLDAALQSFDKAIALKAGYAEAYSNRGIVLQELRQLDAALQSFDKAIALKADYAEAYFNRGTVLQEINQLDEALQSFDKAIALKTGYAEAHWNKSLLNLLRGDFAAGWQGYEWRWGNKHLGKAIGIRTFPQPRWTGNEPLHEKTILLYAEQGLGDTIQFCRYVKSVAELGAKVILEVQHPLAGLLTNLEGVSRVIATGSVLPPFDYRCPLLSLPLAFKTTLNTIPSCVPYLKPPENKSALWKERLGVKTKPRIGLVWSGGTLHEKDRERSITLATLLPLLNRDAEFHSLQKEYRDADRGIMVTENRLRDHASQINDFGDTAAIVEEMDLVISVDTAVAHLAGALGKPVWILLPYAPDFRWLQHRKDSPWYPTARLFRQPALNSWDRVVEILNTAQM